MVEVTQADIDAVAQFRRGIGGKYDRVHHELERVVAAHRLAAEAGIVAWLRGQDAMSFEYHVNIADAIERREHAKEG